MSISPEIYGLCEWRSEQPTTSKPGYDELSLYRYVIEFASQNSVIFVLANNPEIICIATLQSTNMDEDNRGNVNDFVCFFSQA